MHRCAPIEHHFSTLFTQGWTETNNHKFEKALDETVSVKASYKRGETVQGGERLRNNSPLKAITVLESCGMWLWNCDCREDGINNSPSLLQHEQHWWLRGI
jgi:hypothetical protein